MKNYITLGFSLLVGSSAFAQTSDIDRAQLILQALNSRPEQWIAPIEITDIHLKGGAGRVDVNKKSKFSYYVQIEEPTNPKSKITLVPMATSRYTPTYYQTDAWWDANAQAIADAKKNGTPAPRQDMNEVAEWLKEMKLSTNPMVFEINPGRPLKTPSLQEFLYQFYKDHYVKDGKITLYRGGEKVTETGDWLGGVRPRGVRYWTPTATYAWRYARKNPQFLEQLLDGKAPLYVFEMPFSAFTAMVQKRWQQLTLGTELTKNAHNSFESQGRFLDHLAGNSDFMGVGDIGVEFEIRSSSSGANEMLKYFKHPITVEELVLDRVDLLKKTLARLKKARPEEAAQLEEQYKDRIREALLEGKIMVAVREKMSKATVNQLLKELKGRYEVANFDFADFRTFIQEKSTHLSSESGNIEQELKALDEAFRPRSVPSSVASSAASAVRSRAGAAMSCHVIY